MENASFASAPSLQADSPVRQRQRTAFDSALSIRLVTVAATMEECARLLLSDTHYIGLTELRIIGHLMERPASSVSEISRDLQVDKAWISRLLKQLESRQLLVRSKDGSDGRQSIASLSDAGQEFHASVMSRVTPYYGEIVEGVNEQLLTASLDKLELNLRALIGRLRADMETK